MNPHRRTESSLIYILCRKIKSEEQTCQKYGLAWPSELRRLDSGERVHPHVFWKSFHTSHQLDACVLVDTRAASRFSTSTRRGPLHIDFKSQQVDTRCYLRIALRSIKLTNISMLRNEGALSNRFGLQRLFFFFEADDHQHRLTLSVT